MLRTTRSLLVAQAVLAMVNYNLPDEDLTHSDFWVESYSNGREQGMTIGHISGKKISFSEYRRSDSIVVYIGSNFSMQGNVPPESIYQAATHFGFGEYDKAATFIVEAMQKMEKEFHTVKPGRAIKQK